MGVSRASSLGAWSPTGNLDIDSVIGAAERFAAYFEEGVPITPRSTKART
jgi:hypothetical protein